ncbi:hypothetical protein BGZ60DRAFT_570784 [Tricladium varicosporioides]|nr:hypothetical protein BGZ60DRAFT_570784 [Hymenoscyphus varicosporioides]
MSHSRNKNFDEREGLQVEYTGLEIGSSFKPGVEKEAYTLHEHARETGSYSHRREEQRQICGLRYATFFLTVALVSVVVGGAVGGGIGSSLASKNKSVNNSQQIISTIIMTASGTTSTSNPTAASTSISSPIRVPTAGTLFLDCPNIDRTTVTITPARSSKSYSFHIACGSEFVSASGSGQAIDILPIVAYSLIDCLSACASYNDNLGSNGCVSVTFNSQLSNVKGNGGTCWLKNSTAKENLGLGDTSVGVRLV